MMLNVYNDNKYSMVDNTSLQHLVKHMNKSKTILTYCCSVTSAMRLSLDSNSDVSIMITIPQVVMFTMSGSLHEGFHQ